MGEFMSGAVAFQWSMASWQAHLKEDLRAEDQEEYGLTLSPGFLKGQAS